LLERLLLERLLERLLLERFLERFLERLLLELLPFNAVTQTLESRAARNVYMSAYLAFSTV
jgi:hypothetical protein